MPSTSAAVRPQSASAFRAASAAIAKVVRPDDLTYWVRPIPTTAAPCNERSICPPISADATQQTSLAGAVSVPIAMVTHGCHLRSIRGGRFFLDLANVGETRQS